MDGRPARDIPRGRCSGARPRCLRAALITFATAAAVLLIAPGIGAANAAPAPTGGTTFATSGGKPAVPGPGEAYLGAWLNPAGADSHNPAELAQLPAFNAALGRPLSFVHVYQRWTNIAPDRQLRQVLDQGAIPLIDWSCGRSDAAIVAGADDAMILDYAKRLAALRAPIFLRWYYEPNFPNSANYARCIGADGPPGYREAFRHIHQLFAAAGATNVAFVWCLAMAGYDKHWLDYYPGSEYVDWIAADGYDRSASPSRTAFGDKFRKWYEIFSAPRFGKPMMISETGARPESQQSYLDEVPGDLLGSNLAQNSFPLIRAVSYFDAPGQYPYQFTADGLASFSALSRQPVFLPARQPATVAVTASPSAPLTGQAVRLTAQVGVPYRGGTVTFLADGVPVPGCEQLPVENAAAGPGVAPASCAVRSLAAGAHHVVASYSGTADYAPATSAQLTATVRARPPVTARPARTSCARALSTRACRVLLAAPAQPIKPAGLTRVAPPAGVGPGAVRRAADPAIPQLPTLLAAAGSTVIDAPGPSAFTAATAGRPTPPTPVPGWVPYAGCAAITLLLGYLAGSWLADRRPRRPLVRSPVIASQVAVES